MSITSLVEPGINGAYLQNLLNFLEGKGLAANKILKYAPGLPSDLSVSWVKARDINNIYIHASKLLSDPYIGLEFGKQSTANLFKIVGFLAISAPDVLTALKSISCYQSLYSRIGKMTIRENSDHISICWDAIWPRALMANQAVEASISGWHHIGLSMMGDSAKVSSITFKHENPGCLSRYEDAFGCPVYFGREFDAIYLQKSDLKKKVVQSDELVHEALLEKSDKIVTTYDHEPLIDKVEKILIESGQGCMLSIENVAEALSISSVELRKHLKKSNLTYRTLLDRTKFIEALPYLMKSDTDIAIIAQELGFSEQSAFTRAFKRWTDMSPLAYRNNLLAFLLLDKNLGSTPI